MECLCDTARGHSQPFRATGSPADGSASRSKSTRRYLSKSDAARQRGNSGQGLYDPVRRARRKKGHPKVALLQPVREPVFDQNEWLMPTSNAVLAAVVDTCVNLVPLV